MPVTTNDSDSVGFLLDVFHRQQGERFVIFAIGKLQTGQTFGIVDDRERPGFFVRLSDLGRAQQLEQSGHLMIQAVPWKTMDGEYVARVSSARLSDVRAFGTRLQENGIRTYEADISPARQYLMNRCLHGAVRVRGLWRQGSEVDRVYLNPELAPADWEPELAVLTLDIETDRRADKVYAVSLVGTGPHDKHVTEQVLILGPPSDDDPPYAFCYPDEAALLQAVATRVGQIDPDVITGWNVIDFDLAVLQKRFRVHGNPFALGRTGEKSWYRESDTWGGSRMTIHGRQVIDAMRLARVIPHRYEDYRLSTVARQVLGRDNNLEADDDETMPEVILRAYREDRKAFCDYCLEDSRLVRDILSATGLIKMTLRRSLLTGLALESAWGSITAFDFLYISRLHQQRIVAPTLGVDRLQAGGAPGGLVMEPRAGLHRHVFVFDFRSLYPSIISTFNIDPLAHVRSSGYDSKDTITAPNGATFDRDRGILPEILEGFFSERAQANDAGDELASFTYKIVMNSFYGVLAAHSCRFASSQLAGAITEFGHQILRWTAQLLESMGAKALYGDTDSLFIDTNLPDDITVDEALSRATELCRSVNNKLAEHLHERYGVESRLELEFEKYYRRLLLPVSRADETRARAKGYAGLRVGPATQDLDIVGMEAVRQDWTDLSHRLQRDLLHLLFHDAPSQTIEQCVADCIKSVRAGERDGDLVYRKRLKKNVREYTKSIPPHVKAARLLPKASGTIHYVITTEGPQPVGRRTAPIDYSHYIDKQIRPIVRTIAQVCDIDSDTALTRQLKLFNI